MGHTNYWEVHNDNCQGAYNLAKDEMRAFMHYCLVKHKIILDIRKDIDPLTNEPYNDINFNGVQDEACENFHLPELVKDIYNDSISFCKTAEREYDPIVMGCLFILKKYLGNGCTIKSDGYNHKSLNANCDNYCDWGIKEGYKLFKEYQTISPNGWDTGGILPLFKPGKK